MRRLDFKGTYIPESVCRALEKIVPELLPEYGEAEITCEKIMAVMDIGFGNPENGKSEVSEAVFKIIRENGGEILSDKTRFIKVCNGKDPDDLNTFVIHHIAKTGPTHYKK